MNETIKVIGEFVNTTYNAYDMSIINFPTASGIVYDILDIIKKDSLDTVQTTLMLCRNTMIKEQIYQEFSLRLNLSFNPHMDDNALTRMGDRQHVFDNGSTIIFGVYNKVRQPIFIPGNNIIFVNVDLYKANQLNLDMISKLNDYDKRVFVNCNFKHHVENIILRKNIGSKFKYEMTHLDDYTALIRTHKIKKIKVKIS